MLPASEARLWRPGARPSQGASRGAGGGACRATSWLRGVWASAWSLARMFCTVLMAEVVGEVEASLSWGLEE